MPGTFREHGDISAVAPRRSSACGSYTRCAQVVFLHVSGDGRLPEKLADVARIPHALLRDCDDALVDELGPFGHFWPGECPASFNAAVLECVLVPQASGGTTTAAGPASWCTTTTTANN